MRSGRRQEGFTYLTALFLVAVVGAGLAATAEIWSHARQREKEAELLWIGNQFRQAIGLYYQRSPGAVKRYPEKLEELLEDRRYLSMQRYLRRIYADPITGKAEWGLVTAPGGGVMGVYSLAPGKPIKTGLVETRGTMLEGASRYAGWRFVYEPPHAAAQGLPGARKQR
jgi:type II secretory pathway pseudopilin PulG